MDPSDSYLLSVLDVARVLHAHAHLDDEALVAKLRQAGLDALDAELAVVFVPIAFARVLLGQMGAGAFPTTYLVQDRRGSWVARSAPDELWYRAALRVATATVTHGYGSDECASTPSKAVFGTVVSRSPELALASDLLDRKGDLSAAAFHPPRLLRVTAESFAPGHRWWRFWRRGE